MERIWEMPEHRAAMGIYLILKEGNICVLDW